jgi:magnesium-transporting ATPase (P-type)
MSDDLRKSPGGSNPNAIQYNLKSLIWLISATGVFLAQIVVVLSAQEELPFGGIIIPSLALCLLYLWRRQMNVFIAYCLIVLCGIAIAWYVNPNRSLLWAVPPSCFFANLLTFPASILSLLFACLFCEEHQQIDDSKRRHREKLAYWLIGLSPISVLLAWILIQKWTHYGESQNPISNQDDMFHRFLLLLVMVVLALFSTLIGLVLIRFNRR